MEVESDDDDLSDDEAVTKAPPQHNISDREVMDLTETGSSPIADRLVRPWTTIYRGASTSDASNSDCGVRMLWTVFLIHTGNELHISAMEQATSLQLRRLLSVYVDAGDWPFPISTDQVQTWLSTPSAQQEELVQRLWSPSEEMKKAKWTTVGDQELTLADACVLAPGNGSDSWLTDPLVNACLHLIRKCAHTPGCVVSNSFFLQKMSLLKEQDEPWDMLLRWMSDESIQTMVAMIVPVNIDVVHWGLLHIQFHDCVINVYPGTIIAEADSQTWTKFVRNASEFGEWLLQRQQREQSEVMSVLLSKRSVFFNSRPYENGTVSPPNAAPEGESTNPELDLDFAASVLSRHNILLQPSLDNNVLQVQQMRDNVVLAVRSICEKNRDFKMCVAIVWCVDNHTHYNEDDTEEHVDSYLSSMSQSGTWGGHVELEAMPTVLGHPVIIVEHPVKGTYAIRALFGPDVGGNPVYFLRINVDKEEHAHYQLLIPCVACKDLQHQNGYGPMLEAAMSFVGVHPQRIKVPFGPSTAHFWAFGVPANGDCLFTTAVLAHFALSPEWQPGGSMYKGTWSRDVRLTLPMKAKAAAATSVWSSTSSLRDCAWSGDSAFDETTVYGSIKLQVQRSALGVGTSDSSVVMDIGSGLGSTLIFNTIAGGNATCLGIEKSRGIHILAKVIQTKLASEDVPTSHVVWRCMDVTDITSFNAVTHIMMYDGHKGRMEDNNQQHFELILRIMQSPTMVEFSSTKMQSYLFTSYKSKSAEFHELAEKWTCVTLGDIGRRGLKPLTCMYVRKDMIYDGQLSSTQSKSAHTQHCVSSMLRAVVERRSTDYGETCVIAPSIVGIQKYSYTVGPSGTKTMVILGSPFKCLLTGYIATPGHGQVR